MKLKVGMEMPEIIYTSPYEANKSYLEETKGDKSVLLFLRYYGCTVCQLDLLELKEIHEKFQDKNVNVKVVLQSDPHKLKALLDENPLPFEIICDPEKKLYQKFEIAPAGSKLKLAGGLKTILKMNKAKKLGLQHGAYEGEELQLPALFIIDKTGTIEFAKYCKSLADLPSVSEIAGLAGL